MVQWPIPKSVKQLRGFLGLAGYYRRFIKDFGKIAQPLTVLLKVEEGFQWNEKASKAMEALKQALVTTPVLTFLDFFMEFLIETDASGMGIGAVLMQ